MPDKERIAREAEQAERHLREVLGRVENILREAEDLVRPQPIAQTERR